MNTETLNNFIGQTVRVLMKGEQTPPCPPNGYLGILTKVESEQITVNCKLGYTQQDKTLSFENKDCKISKILLEESQKILYEETTLKKTKLMNQIDRPTIEVLLSKSLEKLNIQTTTGHANGMLVDISETNIIIAQKRKKTIPFANILSITSGFGENLCILYQN